MDTPVDLTQADAGRSSPKAVPESPPSTAPQPATAPDMPDNALPSIPPSQTPTILLEGGVAEPIASASAPAAPAPASPHVALCFLLVSGRRRNMTFDPQNTVGRVKELVWSSWPDDWQDERPPGPSSLRILYLGKILQDEDTLQKLKFPSFTPAPDTPTPAPTIVHLSIRPFAPSAEANTDTLKKKFQRLGSTSGGEPSGEREARAGGCCCVIC